MTSWGTSASWGSLNGTVSLNSSSSHVDLQSPHDLTSLLSLSSPLILLWSSGLLPGPLCTPHVPSTRSRHLLFPCLDTALSGIQVASRPLLLMSLLTGYLIRESFLNFPPHHHHHLALLWLASHLSQLDSVYLVVVCLPHLEGRLHDTWGPGCSLYSLCNPIIRTVPSVKT